MRHAKLSHLVHSLLHMFENVPDRDFIYRNSRFKFGDCQMKCEAPVPRHDFEC